MQPANPTNVPEPEQVIAAARAAIMERAGMAAAERRARERRWQPLFFVVLAILLLGVLFAPAATLERKLILALSGVCAQEHNLIVGGVQLPLCARDSGMYLSLLATLAVVIMRGRGRAGALPPWPILTVLAGLVAIMGVDGVNSLLNEIGLVPWYTPRNDLRALTGMGAGVGLAVVLVLLLNRSLRRDVDDSLPVLGQWRELGLIALIDGALLASALLDVAPLAWPLALLVFAGVTGTLFVTALVAIAVILRYDGTITHPAQLARPATLALAFMGVFLVVMALLRAVLVNGGPAS